MKSDNRDRPRNTPARLDDPDLWAKLLSSSHRGAKRRRTLESMLKLWGQEHGASAVAVYAPGTSGLQLVANAGDRTVSQILTPGQRGDDSLQELELPGSYWVVVHHQYPSAPEIKNLRTVHASANERVSRLRSRS